MAMSENRIDRIELTGLCPAVFSDEEVANSEIWLKDFTFRRGQHYMIEAGSGTGKSSLCSFIYFSRSDFRGKLSYDGRAAETFTIDEICLMRQRHIALLPQDLRLFPELSVIDNIMLKNRLTDFRSEKEIIDMLALLGIENKVNTPAGQLSIGQMQRVALIRALCQPFDFIMLDEPVSHLDKANNLTVARLVADEAKKQDAGIITTSVGNQLLLDDAKIIRL